MKYNYPIWWEQHSYRLYCMRVSQTIRIWRSLNTFGCEWWSGTENIGSRRGFGPKMKWRLILKFSTTRQPSHYFILLCSPNKHAAGLLRLHYDVWTANHWVTDKGVFGYQLSVYISGFKCKKENSYSCPLVSYSDAGFTVELCQMLISESVTFNQEFQVFEDFNTSKVVQLNGSHEITLLQLCQQQELKWSPL